MAASNVIPLGAEHALLPREASDLVAALHDIAMQVDLAGVIAAVRRRARSLVGADGVTFVLREDDKVYYAEEDAIAPLWRGQRFAADACISGWAMIHDAVVTIADIYSDARIPHDAYRPTFVKSLVMVPIRRGAPIGCIGAYWASEREATARDIMLLEALANACAIAVRNGELLREAQLAARARDEFLGTAAHELRTPLTSAMLHVQSAQRALLAGHVDEVAPRLERARTAGRRLSDLIDRLLSFAERMESKEALALEPVDLRAVAEAVVERLGPIAEESGCAVSCTFRGDSRGVWAADELDAVLANLVGNALRYAPGSPIEIAVDGEDADEVVLTVADHGPGIANDARERLFKRYERGVSAIHQPGFGLGLAIVRAAVHAHGGTVAVESGDGGGATFVVRLPRNAAIRR